MLFNTVYTHHFIMLYNKGCLQNKIYVTTHTNLPDDDV